MLIDHVLSEVHYGAQTAVWSCMRHVQAEPLLWSYLAARSQAKSTSSSTPLTVASAMRSAARGELLTEPCSDSPIVNSDSTPIAPIVR